LGGQYLKMMKMQRNFCNEGEITLTLEEYKLHIGRFDDIKDAINARKEAEHKYFKPLLDQR
jgi:hypothetical protein